MILHALHAASTAAFMIICGLVAALPGSPSPRPNYLSYGAE